MSLDIPEEEAKRIAEAIGSDSSPVGIDAKKTHVIIIRKLEEIEQRLKRLESRVDRPDD